MTTADLRNLRIFDPLFPQIRCCHLLLSSKKYGKS